MKKSFISIIFLLFTLNAYSLPINYIYGSFRASQSMDRIFFVPTFNNDEFTFQEKIISDLWLKQIFNGTQFIYNDLSVTFNIQPSVHNVVRGCFWGWLKQLDLHRKLMLMEYLKPETPIGFLGEENSFYSEFLNRFTQINRDSCRFEDPIKDLSFTYIFIGLEQYLSDKTSYRPEDEKYESILGKSYSAQYQDYSMNELKYFLAYIDNFEMYSPQAPADVIHELVKFIEKSSKESWNETEIAFLFIEILLRNLPNIFEYMNDYYKMIPYQNGAKLIYDKCFVNGKFLKNICGNEFINKNFALIRLSRSSGYSDNLVWVGQ